MALLDDLSGFEFEDTMEEVFRKTGYENVQQARKTADKGRDIIMEEPNDNGPSTAVIVECKHTATVGRPVVQKLDSAVKTYDHHGPKRGMIVTTGRFTSPAQEYADGVDIELMSGEDIRSIADDIGLDLYNGRIEIICDEMLSPYHSHAPVAPFRTAFADVSNITDDDIPSPETTVTLIPIITADTHVKRTFETGAGVIHTVDESNSVAIEADRDGPRLTGHPVNSLVGENTQYPVPVDTDELHEYFDAVNQRRFGMTETEYREWLVDREVQRHTETVTYTGDNNVTYNKECEPATSDVTVSEFTSVFVPRIYGAVQLQQHTYSLDWYAVGDETAVVSDTVQSCVHCEAGDVPSWDWSLGAVTAKISAAMTGSSYTFCGNCGAVTCREHMRTEASTGDPVCIGCAVTGRYAGAKKYFTEADSRESFAGEYDDRSMYQKPFVNIPGVIAVTAITFLLLLLVI